MKNGWKIKGSKLKLKMLAKKKTLKNMVADANSIETTAISKIFLFFFTSSIIEIVTAVEETIPPKIPVKITPSLPLKIFIKM